MESVFRYMGSFELISPAMNRRLDRVGRKISVSVSLGRNPILIGSGATVWWLVMEHSGILISTVRAISQVFFLTPAQQFGAVSLADSIAAC